MQETEAIDGVDRGEGERTDARTGACGGGGDGEDVVICDGISIRTDRQEQVKARRRRRGMRPAADRRARERSRRANGSTYPNGE